MKHLILSITFILLLALRANAQSSEMYNKPPPEVGFVEDVVIYESEVRDQFGRVIETETITGPPGSTVRVEKDTYGRITTYQIIPPFSDDNTNKVDTSGITGEGTFTFPDITQDGDTQISGDKDKGEEKDVFDELEEGLSGEGDFELDGPTRDPKTTGGSPTDFEVGGEDYGENKIPGPVFPDITQDGDTQISDGKTNKVIDTSGITGEGTFSLSGDKNKGEENDGFEEKGRRGEYKMPEPGLKDVPIDGYKNYEKVIPGKGRAATKESIHDKRLKKSSERTSDQMKKSLDAQNKGNVPGGVKVATGDEAPKGDKPKTTKQRPKAVQAPKGGK